MSSHLSICLGGLALAGVVVWWTGHDTSARSAENVNAIEAEASGNLPKNQPFPDREGVQVPSRSSKSREEDPSLATRLRYQHTVMIGGQIMCPGPVGFNNRLTLFDAIQKAGGPTVFGSMRRILLHRKGERTVHDLRKNDAPPVFLEPDDVIEIPQGTGYGR